MKIYFVSSGIGGLDNLTIKALRLIKSCPIIIYAGSLIPNDIINQSSKTSVKYDSSSLNLEEICRIFMSAKHQNKDVVRLQSGDTSLYSAINEQIEFLKHNQIDFEVVAGVTSASAAAAELNLEFTAPNICQTIILTRINGRTNTMPASENYIEYVKSGACVVIHLAITKIRKIISDLSPIIGANSIICIAYGLGYDDKVVEWVKLCEAHKLVRKNKIVRQAIVIINPFFNLNSNQNRSKLYSKEYEHLFRN